MNNQSKIVTNIIGKAVDGFIKVNITSEIFNQIIGKVPKNQNFEQINSGKDNIYIRKFHIALNETESVELYTNYNSTSRTNFFIMKEEDAKRYAKDIITSPYTLDKFITA